MTAQQMAREVVTKGHPHQLKYRPSASPLENWHKDCANTERARGLRQKVDHARRLVLIAVILTAAFAHKS
jgi:hypothetical protein